MGHELYEDVLRPAQVARRLGVETRFVIQAMYERRLPLVRLPDGLLGIPVQALDGFQINAA